MRGGEREKGEKEREENGECPRNKKVGTRPDASAGAHGASSCEKLTISGDVPLWLDCPMEESLPRKTVDACD